MGIFERWFRRSAARPLDPDALRDQLFDAVGDARSLSDLCQSHEATILEHFPSWTVVPADVRGDPRACSRWAEGLIGVAQYFAAQGRPELIQRLSPPAERNPLAQWKSRIIEARDHIASGQLSEAGRLLHGCLEEFQSLVGTGSDHYLALTYGGLGQCEFHGGAAHAALPRMQKALQLCEASADEEGIQTYVLGLYQLHRYLGETEVAAEFAERLAGGAAEDTEKRRWRRQAALVRRGEPLNRVVVQVGGERFELDEVPHVQGSVQFHFERNRIALSLAETWIERGEARGAAGGYEEALACFEKAAQIDKFHPHPHYLAGQTLLSLRRAEPAVASFERAEALAPGWYHCRAGHALAHRIARGEVAYEAFALIVELGGHKDPETRVRLAAAALDRTPQLPALHLELGRGLAELGRRGEAGAAFDQGLALDGDVDVRTRLLVELANVTASPLERARHLEEAVALSGNLVAGAMARVMLRSVGTPA